MKLVIKLLLFLLPLLTLIGINIYLSEQKEIQKIKNGSICFVGSSRVQYGINPELLNEVNRKTKTYNMGISASTFYHNMIFARYLISNFKPKELFIELSPIIYKINLVHLDYNIDELSLINLFNPIMENIKIAETFLFTKLSLRNNMRKLILKDKIQDNRIGYEYTLNNRYFSSESFLRIEDLDKKQNIDVTDHLNLILDLKNLAKKHNTKIRYFLPLTFNRLEEREIVSAVYQSLSKEHKIVYTSEFLNKISVPENLMDKNHFNSKGAKIMTTFFKKHYITD